MEKDGARKSQNQLTRKTSKHRGQSSQPGALSESVLKDTISRHHKITNKNKVKQQIRNQLKQLDQLELALNSSQRVGKPSVATTAK